MPLDRILPETDGPFGTKSDKPLFPWEGNEVIAPLADALGVTTVDVAAQLNSNFHRFTADVSFPVKRTV